MSNVTPLSYSLGSVAVDTLDAASPVVGPGSSSLPTKIQAEHRVRLAIVYVRQSTQQQVLEHRESTARQYGMVERAVALGWPRERVVVIDDDQGQSGSSCETRVGFQRLLGEVSLDHVGLILGLEMSRFARSCKDWHALLEVCAIYRTLLADADGLYDPSDYNDRLLLGLKGTMSEAELHILKGRLHRGMWNKAERGEVLNHAPIGYVRTVGGDYVIDPDEQVQSVVRLIFQQFERRGSVSGLLKWLVRHDVKLPVRPHAGVNRGALEWRRPNRATLLNLLHHPIYAGAYRWGHREVDPRKKIAGRPGTGRKARPHDACRVLIRNRFPAYLSWEQFEENQRKLTENSTRGRYLAAPRNGPSVLAGLVVCGRCGQRMLVGYGGVNHLRYSCQRAAIDYGEDVCQSLSGKVLDEFVSQRLLQAVAPAALELNLAAADDLEQERARLDAQWRQRLERGTYECQLARKQYDAVDPQHRLVARELEHRWEQSLRAQEQLQADYTRFLRDCPLRLSNSEREQIRALAEDLPTLWRAASTTPEDRQTIARLLLDRVVVSIEGDTNRVDVELYWTGGFTSRHVLKRPVSTYRQLTNYSQFVDRLEALRTSSRTLREIADTLNSEGFLPPKRAPRFTPAILSRFLREHGQASGPRPRTSGEPAVLQTDEWWLADLARELQMPTATLHRWQRVGWVTAHKVPQAGGRWVIYADDEELSRLRQLRIQPRGWSDEPIPKRLTTPKPRPAR